MLLVAFSRSNILFARTQCHHVGFAALRVDGFADDTSGDLAHVLVFRGKEAQIGSAEAQTGCQALPLANDNISAQVPPDF